MVNKLGKSISIMSWSLTLTASEMILKLIIEILIMFGGCLYVLNNGKQGGNKVKEVRTD